MVRVKAPYGSITPEQLEVLADIAERYSRGWGHLTTRQNIQFHFVELERVPSLLRDLAQVGLTTREACGDTVRNITGCHLAGACPYEVLDISPWAEAAFRHFLHHPYAQRLPEQVQDQLLRLRHRLRAGHVQRRRCRGRLPAAARRGHRGRFPGICRRRPRGQPSSGPGARRVHAREELLATLEAVLRTFDHYGNRDNKLRARLKWVVDTMGIDELRRAHCERAQAAPRLQYLARRHTCCRAGAGRGTRRGGWRPHAHPVGTPVTLRLGPGGTLTSAGKRPTS